MMAAWMLYVLAVALLLFAAAVGADYGTRAAGAATRFVWLAALLGATAIPVTAALRSRQPSAQTPATRQVVVSRSSIASNATRPVDVEPSLIVVRRGLPPLFDGLAGAASFDRPLAAILVGAPMFAAVSLLLTLVRVRRMRASLEEGRLDGHAVLLSHDLGPAVLGVFRARIVVPRWFLALDADERRVILAHEREHAKALDPALIAVAMVLASLQPWNVIAWLMVARLRLAIEADCDRRVLRADADPRQYGRLLLAVYERAAHTRVARIAFVGRRSALERRILRLVNGAPSLASGWSAAAIGVALLAAAAACSMPAPPARARDSVAADTRSAPLVSVVGAQPLCMRSMRDPLATSEMLQRAVHQRHPELRAHRDGSSMVAALVLDENCAVVRDTLFAQPRSVGPDQLFTVGFPGVAAPRENRGIIWAPDPYSHGRLTITYVVVPSAALAARRARDECGFGIRFDEICFANGPVVIRMVDSVRAVIAVRRFKADNAPVDHLFLVTLVHSNAALSSQRLAHGVIGYHRGALYVEDFLTRDPPLFFGSTNSPELARSHEHRELRQIDELIGIAHYGSGWLTLEQVDQLAPAKRCRGARGACWEVDGKSIEFPA